MANWSPMKIILLRTTSYASLAILNSCSFYAILAFLLGSDFTSHPIEYRITVIVISISVGIAITTNIIWALKNRSELQIENRALEEKLSALRLELDSIPPAPMPQDIIDKLPAEERLQHTLDKLHKERDEQGREKND